MDMQGERLIPAAPDATWAALNDPDVLKACIAGCESLEKTGDDEYLAVVKMRIGPVNARFKGRLKLENVVAPTSYTLVFDGQGGAAGFGKGSADVRLAPNPAGTTLQYSARAQIGGKLAQVGSRLIDGAAAKIAEDFFTAFERCLGAPPAAADGAAEAAAEAAAGAGATASPDATTGAPAATKSAGPPTRWWMWIVAIVVIAVLLSYWSG